jgi:hypothetical protein
MGNISSSVEKLETKAGIGDYVLIEVSSYLEKTASNQDGEFYEWFKRAYKRYQKGDWK